MQPPAGGPQGTGVRGDGRDPHAAPCRGWATGWAEVPRTLLLKLPSQVTPSSPYHCTTPAVPAASGAFARVELCLYDRKRMVAVKRLKPEAFKKKGDLEVS